MTELSKQTRIPNIGAIWNANEWSFMNYDLFNLKDNTTGCLVEKKMADKSPWYKAVSHRVTIKKVFMCVTHYTNVSTTKLRPMFNSGLIRHTLMKILTLELKSSLKYLYNLVLIILNLSCQRLPTPPQFLLFATRCLTNAYFREYFAYLD